MINLTWLKTFCTLAEVGHFTRTAERLYMTQSGVSQHINKLEEQLGVALIIRAKKQFKLTDAGERLLEQADSVFLALTNLEQTVVADPPFEGLVRIMSPGSVGLKIYPHLLELQQQHAKLAVDYRFAPNSSIQQALERGDVDVGFMTRPSTSAQVCSEVIANEPLLLVTPVDIEEPSWPVLCELGFIDHPDGAHHAHLLLSANYRQFNHSDLFHKSGFCNQIHLILEPVSRGLGFTVLPAHAVNAFAQQQGIRVHHLTHEVCETLYLCWQRGKVMQNRVKSIIEQARKYL
ncbi:LysR family transcriptional regulator [Pseudoalteromonas sp. SSDWG2]|uniref:LysR family transcriptional regulator n=1 Tax=Pseudoalteromonas sp. SSDWG2 TaxID=3139391 RepID=UPI003BAB5932